MWRERTRDTLRVGLFGCRQSASGPVREVEYLLLHGSHESVLLLLCLEASVTELGRSVDELERDLLQGRSASLREERLSEGEAALLGTNDAALDHNEVLIHNTIVRETSQRGDGLLSQIELGGGVVLALLGKSGLSDTVDLLVLLSSVEVTVLTSTRDGVRDTRRMPCSDTSDLSQTLVGLTGQLAGSPSVGDTLESVTLGDTDDIDHFVLREEAIDGHSFLEQAVSEVDLLLHGSTVHLDLHKVGLLLGKVQLTDVGVGNDTDDLAVLLDGTQVSLNVLSTVLVLLGILGERVLLGLVEVSVESSLDLLIQMLGPDGLQGSQASRSLDVTDNTDHEHGGGFDDGDGFDGFLLVELGPRLVDFTRDMCHAGLVAHEGS